MRVKTYGYLCAMNEGFDQVQRSLKVRDKHSPLERSQTRRVEQLAALGAEETDRAGRLFVRRKARGSVRKRRYREATEPRRPQPVAEVR